MDNKTIPFPAPELRVDNWIDANGNPSLPLTLDQLGSVYVVLYCFQSWCPGCHSHGFPTLKKLVDGLSNKGFSFAAIQTVFEGHDENTIDKVQELQKRHNLAIPFGHDCVEGGFPTIMEDYQTRGTPWFIIIDPERDVIFSDFRLNGDRLIHSINNKTHE